MSLSSNFGHGSPNSRHRSSPHPSPSSPPPFRRSPHLPYDSLDVHVRVPDEAIPTIGRTELVRRAAVNLFGRMVAASNPVTHRIPRRAWRQGLLRLPGEGQTRRADLLIVYCLREGPQHLLDDRPLGEPEDHPRAGRRPQRRVLKMADTTTQLPTWASSSIRWVVSVC